jgi:Flp pilus assembly protein CpaB
MRKLNFILLTIVFAFILLVVEIILIRSASEYEPKLGIVFARTKIPEGALIKSNMLEERKISAGAVHKQSVKDPDEIIGKIARIEIEEGEMILNAKLIEAGEMEELSYVDEKSRLFTVEFEPDQVNGWRLKAGQYVDIIYIPNERAVKQDELQSQTDGVNGERKYVPAHSTGMSGIKRIRNVRIAALIDNNGNLVRDSNRTSLPKYVSFEVNDSLDEFLAYAKDNGRLEVSVIPFQD